MIYRVRKLHYLTQAMIPAGWLGVMIWFIVTGKDLQDVLFAAAITAVFSAIFDHALYRQSRTPVAEIDAEGIRVHNVWHNPQHASWPLVVRLKKYPVLGYKLEAAGKDIWLPVGMLSRHDVENFLREVNEHLQKHAGRSA